MTRLQIKVDSVKNWVFILYTALQLLGTLLMLLPKRKH